MSKDNKTTTISHRALDEIIKLKTSVITDIGSFKKEIITAVKEIADKHNELATQIAAVETLTRNVAAFTASEMGKMGGSVQQQLTIVGQATSAIDLNVLALAELNRELVGQLVQIDTLFNKLHGSIISVIRANYSVLRGEGMASKILNDSINDLSNALEISQSEVAVIKDKATEWYDKLVATSFRIVQERMAKEDAKRQEEIIEKEKQVADNEELKNVEEELSKANLDDLSVSVTSGGEGSIFPEGAEIFGG